MFTENWILRHQKADFDDLYTIGSEFASPTRSHTPFPTVSAKNAVLENFDCQILRKFSEKFGTIFCEKPLTAEFRQNGWLARRNGWMAPDPATHFLIGGAPVPVS